ncbi:MAG: glycosyltransferase family 39 protein, partial [Acidobacteriota bacterium]
NIPFLLITVWAIFLWSARWFSRPTALVALFLLLNLPTVIGHFSVATTDFSQAATLLLAAYATLRWSEDQTARSTILLGLAISLAILCKLSNLFFVLLILLVVLGLRWWQRKSPPLALRQISRDTLIILVIVMVVICVAYRFYSPPLSVKQGHHPLLDQRIPHGSLLSRIAYLAVETPSPFNSFISGINEVRNHNRTGHLSYLLGEVRMDGWWYFFPLVLLLKTPLAILVLFLLFLFTLFKNRRSAQPDGRLTLLAISTSILLFSMTSNINAGVRHILSIYFFLALALSDFIVTQFRMKSHLRPLLGILLLMFGYESLEAGSDHIGYFNRLAGSRPERILDESDLDWGQGIYQLSQYLEEKGVSKVSLVYFGTAPLDQVGLPPLESARIEEGKTKGYVAVSTHYLAVPYSQYQWLNRYQPIHRIGNTFNIYFFE